MPKCFILLGIVRDKNKTKLGLDQSGLENTFVVFALSYNFTHPLYS